MFDRLRRTTDVAKFKADQLLRVNRVQNEIYTLQREIDQVRARTAALTYELHQQGRLKQEELTALCQTIDQYNAQIGEKNAQIAAIRAEQPVLPVVAAQALAQATLPCPHCHQPVRTDAAFCPHCGKAITWPEMRACPSCHANVPLSAQFCPKCGQALPSIAEQAAPPPPAAEPNEPPVGENPSTPPTEETSPDNKEE